MPITVQHLNADTTFLLTFSPDLSSNDSAYPQQTLTILCDPWLVGDSIVTHPKFAVTKLTVPPLITDLNQIPEPDIVLISQNKPDHCHKRTLLQLPPNANTYIVAEPGAANTIKKWNHFSPSRVIGLPKYDSRKESQIRFDLPKLTPIGLPGEVAIAFIPAKNYMTGLHNAIGITYRAPTPTKSVASVSTVDLPMKKQELPPSPAIHSFPPISLPRTSCLSNNSSPQQPSHDYQPNSPPFPVTLGLGFNTDLHQAATNQQATSFSHSQTPPDSPMSTATFDSRATTLNEALYGLNINGISVAPNAANIDNKAITPGRARPISVLFTPHGLPYDPDLIPYITHHLVPSAALPLDLLLHSFDRATNPWYFGGNINAGCRGGSSIARGLMAKAWISAHDEAKDDKGFSVRRLRTVRMNAVEVKHELMSGEEGSWLRRRGWNCDVRSLGVGEELTITHAVGDVKKAF